ncbi:MAG: OmpA family protein [Salibacteraceae bacterium]
MRKILVVLFTLLSVSLLAQFSSKKKAANVKMSEGIRAYRMMDFEAAKSLLNLAIEKDPNFAEPHTLLGDIYLETKDYEKGKTHYKRALQINPNIKPILFLNVAQIELHLSEYDSALIDLNRFKEKYDGVPEPLKPKWDKLVTTAKFGIDAIKNPVPFDPINLGSTVNSPYDDYHPSITVDGNMLVYTGKDKVGATNTGKPVFREDLYHTTKSEDGKWQRSINFGRPVNTPRNNEGSSSISHDGKYLFFTGCELPEGYGSCDLYISERVGGNWSEPKNLGNKINTGAWESHPSLSPDGRTLYFTSSRKGGKGGADIWSSTKDSLGNWQTAVSLSINTKESDMTPYIHADGATFYFSSTGRPGMGGHDIFVAHLNENDVFEDVVNLGYPINSAKEEFGMIADPEGRLAYYASEMDGGLGGLDLYQFELPTSFRPIQTQSISGVVFNRDTKKKLNANVELIDLATGKLIASTSSDKLSGEFLVALASEKDYALNVSKDGFLFYSDNFSLKGKKAESVKLKVPLIPIKAGESVVLKNVFFDVSSFELDPKSKIELNKLVSMLSNNPKLKIEIGGHTDNLGSELVNKKLSEDRAKSVMKYLVSKGINATRLTAKGYGPTQPLADNDSESGRRQNRRTEFKIL